MADAMVNFFLVTSPTHFRAEPSTFIPSICFATPDNSILSLFPLWNTPPKLPVFRRITSFA
jgi:hypothetical protein